MFTMSEKPVKEEYINNKGQDVMLNGETVTVDTITNNTKSGSYERGFKFGSVEYGYLSRTVLTKLKGYRVPIKVVEYSYNHGATWHADSKDAMKSKGKVIISRRAPKGEFAFDSIQRINRNYFGPSYKWTP